MNMLRAPVASLEEDDAQLPADEARYSSSAIPCTTSTRPRSSTAAKAATCSTVQIPYLDLQMWYSACNFGYANKRLNDALKHQIDTLPQVASQYLHPTHPVGQDHRAGR
jgi:adenosylmethionine-8-amino-7-oxononanoate aminotransferase